ncbi:MAG: Stp1/IreP family PP2C-type Ser/Thr phosphatase [Pseudomonadales bacterium]|jgi:protein phosphatase
MQIVALSDTGKVRRNNEDAIAYDSDAAVAVLADGMGGLEAGEVASRLAVDTILELLRERESDSDTALTKAIASANQAVRQVSLSRGVEMGTTVVTWLLTGQGQCLVGHVGDSRAYRYRSGVLRRLTRDHSMVQQMVDDGLLNEAEAETSPNRNVITRALGLVGNVEVDVRSWVNSPGDVYLLCSDGLTDMVSETEIGNILSHVNLEPDELDTVAETLVARANEAGGHDNVTVLLIRPG